LVIANQKGGVGKTTTAVNLATALAQRGLAVLLIDLDPQGNASTGLGVPQAQRRIGSYRLLIDGRPQGEMIRPTAVEHLSVIPADADLVGAEVELVDQAKREFRLREALTRFRQERTYQFILIDCPPSLGLLTVNALVAADGVLVPLQCEFYALEGVTALMRTVEAVRRQLNPAIRLEGIVLTMFDRRNSISGLVAADARGFFGDWVFETVIPRNIRLSEAPSHGQSILQYDPKSSGALAYVALADELLTRLSGAPQPNGSGS
jgi:chromosome partitioning protein